MLLYERPSDGEDVNIDQLLLAALQEFESNQLLSAASQEFNAASQTLDAASQDLHDGENAGAPGPSNDGDHFGAPRSSVDIEQVKA